MRTAAIVLSIVLLTSLALSQISLTSSDAQFYFGPGNSWRSMQNTNLSMTMNVGTASSSAQSWTLPTITYTDTSRMDNILPSATPYASKFPNATHAQRSMQASGGSTSTFYQYYRLKTDSMFSLGNATRIQGPGTDATTYEWKGYLDMVLPFTYGTMFTSRDSTPIGPGAYVLRRSTDVCDAFGTITLPGGSFQALRKNQTVINQTFFGGVLLSSDTSAQFSFITKEGYNVDITPKEKRPGGGIISITGVSYSRVITTPVGIADEGQVLPNKTCLAQNYPNPFNPSTAISYQLLADSFLKLTITDALGREVATLVHEVQPVGNHVVRWDAWSMPSGVYFYRLQAGDASTGSARGFVETKKMILVR